MLETAISETNAAEPTDAGLIRIEGLGARVYHTPMYGEVAITPEKLQRFVENFKKNVRGQEIATNFDHGYDRAKGNKASGWIRDVEVAPSSDDPTQFSVYVHVEPTNEARAELDDKQWKYFSLEWDDDWMDTNTGEVVKDVITGGAFTNKPIAKRMLPVNMSEAMWDELDDESQRMFAVWSTAFVNDLPDSAFLYVQSGGKKDSDGKTVPRSNRHFPYKDANGKVDLPHLRNAIARIPQAGSWLSSSLKSSLQAKARAMLSRAGKSMSEAGVDELTDEILADLASFDEATNELINEQKEWEHSEPGTGPAPQVGSPEQPDPGTGQPVPRIQGDPAREDPAIGGGWRRSPLPTNPDDTKEGDTALTEEELAQLKKLLGLGEDADSAAVLDTAEKKFSEYAQLQSTVSAASQEKKFSEEYPEVWKQMLEDRARVREADAKQFSESVAAVKKAQGEELVKTDSGLSALAQDTITEVHKKFSEGTATRDDFERVIRTIVDGGIVKFSEDGSSREQERPVVNTSSLEGVAAARKLFSEKIAEIQVKDELSLDAAIAEASKQYPELAQAYRVTMPA